MLQQIGFTLAGVFGGFALSIVLWWWLNHKLVPELGLCEELSRRPITYDSQSFRYYFAFKNLGKRSTIDIKIKARLCVPDALHTGSNIKNYFDIALSNYEVFELKPNEMIRMALMLHESSSLKSTAIDRNIREKLSDRTLTLDDIFNEYNESYVYFDIICTDIYSGSRKVFNSRAYHRRDTRSGRFVGRSLEIRRLSDSDLALISVMTKPNQLP